MVRKIAALLFITVFGIGSTLWGSKTIDKQANEDGSASFTWQSDDGAGNWVIQVGPISDLPRPDGFDGSSSYNTAMDDRWGSSNPSQEAWAPERLSEDYATTNTTPIYNYGDDSGADRAGSATSTGVSVSGGGSGSGSGAGANSSSESESGKSGSTASGSGLAGSASGDASQSTQTATNFGDSPFTRFQTKEGIAHIQELVDTDSPELRNSRAQSILAVLEGSGQITRPHRTPQPSSSASVGSAPAIPVQQSPTSSNPASLGQSLDDLSFGRIAQGAGTAYGAASVAGGLFPSLQKAWNDYAHLPDARSPEYQKMIQDSIEANTIHIPTAQERQAWRHPELDKTMGELNTISARLDLLRARLALDQAQISAQQNSYGARLLERSADAFADVLIDVAKKEVERRIATYLRERAIKAEVASKKQNYEAAFKNPQETVEFWVKNYMQKVSNFSYPSLIAAIEKGQKELAKVKAEYMQLTHEAQPHHIDDITTQYIRDAIARIEAVPLEKQSMQCYYEHKKNQLEVACVIAERCLTNLNDLKAYSERELRRKTNEGIKDLEKASPEECDTQLKKLDDAIEKLEKEKNLNTDIASMFQKDLPRINDKLASFNGSYTQRGWAMIRGYWNDSESYKSLTERQHKFQKAVTLATIGREEAIDQLIAARTQRDCIAKKKALLADLAHSELGRTRDIYYRLTRHEHFSIYDQKLLTIMNQAVKDKGARRPFAQLTSEAKALLETCKISANAFDRMAGDKVQQHLYDATTAILQDQARTLQLHQGNKDIVEYIEATTNMSAAALNMIRDGRPVEAIAAVKMAQQFNEATDIAIGVLRGCAQGIGIRALASVTSPFLPPQVQLPLLILSGADMIYQTATMSERYKQFMALSSAEQAESISQFVTAYGVGFLRSCSYFHKAWNGASRIIRGSMVMFGCHQPLSHIARKISPAATVAIAVRKKPIDISFARRVTPEMIAAKYAQEVVPTPVVPIRTAQVPMATAAPTHLLNPLRTHQSLPSTALIAQTAAKERAMRAKLAPQGRPYEFIHPQILLTEVQNLVPAFKRAQQTVEQFIAPNILTPQTKRQVEAYMRQYNAKVDKTEKGLAACPEHKIRYYSGSKHFYIPKKLDGIITNSKDWEKLAKVFDGTMQTPADCGNPAQIWTDYQHLLGPVIKMDCTNAEISVTGFHHDYLGKIRESGILKYTNMVEMPHGFYQLKWGYESSKLKPSGFFPDDWTPAKVMTKIEEALRNPIKNRKPIFDAGEWVVYGRIAEGINIRIVLQANKANKFAPTGKITSAYPYFEILD